MNNADFHIPTYLLPKENQTAFLACSGGIDSMVLLDVLMKSGCNLHVLHVNYHLRGEESNRDEALLREVCTKNDIPCTVKAIFLQDQLDDFGGNLQALAREVRYDFFKETMNKEGGGLLYTAHHQDDQIETFMMRLARRSGTIGLACMREQNENVIRPLLNFSRKEIREFAEMNGIVWREDSSNQSVKYKRNKWRNVLLPALEELSTTLRQDILDLISHFQANSDKLNQKVEPISHVARLTKSVTFEDYDKLTRDEKYALIHSLGWSSQDVLALEKLRESLKSSYIYLVGSDLKIYRESDRFSWQDLVHKEYLLQIEIVNSLPKIFNKEEIYLDAAKIQGELKIRSWQAGDRISPMGMKGSQLVSDIIKDAGVSVINKQSIQVVHDDETIHWVHSLKVGRHALASSTSTRILKISTKKNQNVD